MIRIAFALFSLVALSVIDARPGFAETYRPWCADYGGSSNCGFHSYEQCKMTASGTNTWCVQNPWYLYDARSQRRARGR
jgi:hypothetical protein